MEKIYTERYILRKVEMEDSLEVFNILSDSEVIENLNMEIHKTEKETEELITNYLEEYKEGKKFPYAIIEKDSGKFIGVFLIKLDLYDEDCFEFTIYINKKHWGKGIYSEVLPFMIPVVFEKIGTGNFRGFVKEKNKASSKVLMRNGFELEKIFEVSGLEGKIESYLMTKEYYEKNIKS